LCGCSHDGLGVSTESGDDDGGDVPVENQADLGPAPDLAHVERERCNGIDDDLDGRIDEGCPIRLTHNPLNDVTPSLDDGRVAFIRGSGNGEGDLYLYDLRTGTERRLTGPAMLPSLSGHRVAFWTPSRLSYGIYDLDTGEETLVPHTNYDHGRPFLQGDRMVYSQWDPLTDDAWNENYNIYLYDLSARKLSLLILDNYGQRQPYLDGNRLFWADDRNGHHLISLSHLFEPWSFDFTTGMERQIAARAPDGSFGMIQAFDAGRLVTYYMTGFTTEGPGPFPSAYAQTCQLVMFDVDSGAKTELTAVADYATSDCPLLAWTPDNAALRGQRLVREVDPSGKSDLEMTDLSTGAHIQLTDYPRRSTQPRLDGRWLVWQDDRHDDWELYSIDLIDADAGDLFPEGRSP
jgi:hypothetical protein